MDILEELKIKFKTGDVLTRLLFINCGMYVILLFLDISFILFSFGQDKYAFLVCYYPWSPYTIAFRPWCLATSLFSSWGMWHLMFNMLTLYWLGGVFLRYFTSNHLRGLYILGGIAGMVVFSGIFSRHVLQLVQSARKGVVCGIFYLILGQYLAVLCDVVKQPQLEVGVGE